MKRLRLTVFICVCFCIAQAVSATSPQDRRLFNIETKLKKYSLENTSIAIAVKDAKNHQPIFMCNANKSFKPASNMKLLVAAVSLMQLGERFTFKTQLYTNKKLSPNEIDNLYLSFSGDPSLSVKELIHLLQALKKYKIKGNIYI